MARVLVLNVSSSDLKWSLLDSATEALLANDTLPYADASAEDAAGLARRALAVAGAVDAVGYRVVHGGSRYQEAALVDAAMLETLTNIRELAPLHNPVAVACMRSAMESRPEIPHVAAFDTWFHRTIPAWAATYAIPRAWTEQWGIRRFGFHGLSVCHAARRAHDLLGYVPRRHLVCHLGIGCSVTALRDGLSLDTSMGFTPLDGVMMGTRSGSIDPGTLLFLVRHGIGVDEFYDTLEHRSGLLGVSGVSRDLRQVMAAASAGHQQADLAYRMFVHSVARVCGGMAALLGGLDCLTFTGGAGEHLAALRTDVCRRFGYLGVALDEVANGQDVGDREIGVSGTARVLVTTSREDIEVLRAILPLLTPP
jgi:acetate kinase